MTDVARLGFDIDTRSLTAAQFQMDKTTAAAGKLERATDQNADAFRGMQTSAANVVGTLRSLAPLMSAIAGGMVVRSLTQTAMSMQRMQMALTGVMGSAEGARQEMEWAFQAADKMGQEFETIGQSYTKLAAAGKGLGLSMTDIHTTFEGVMAASTGMALSAYETEGAIQALQQMLAKGTVQAEELRGQLGERIPTAITDGARALGMSVQDLSKAMEQGEVDAYTFVTALTGYWKDAYGPMVENAEGAAKKINEIENAFFKLKSVVIEGGFMEALGRALELSTKVVSSTAMTTGAEALGAAFKLVADNLEGIVLAGTAFAASKIVPAFGQLRQSAMEAYAAQMASFQAMKTGATHAAAYAVSAERAAAASRVNAQVAVDATRAALAKAQAEARNVSTMAALATTTAEYGAIQQQRLRTEAMIAALQGKLTQQQAALTAATAAHAAASQQASVAALAATASTSAWGMATRGLSTAMSMLSKSLAFIGGVPGLVMMSVTALWLFKDATMEVAGYATSMGDLISATWTSIVGSIQVTVNNIAATVRAATAAMQGHFSLAGDILDETRRENSAVAREVGAAWSTAFTKIEEEQDNANKASSEAARIIEENGELRLASAKSEAKAMGDLAKVATAASRVKLEAFAQEMGGAQRALAAIDNQGVEILETADNARAAAVQYIQAEKAKQQATEDTTDALTRQAGAAAGAMAGGGIGAAGAGKEVSQVDLDAEARDAASRRAAAQREAWAQEAQAREDAEARLFEIVMAGERQRIEAMEGGAAQRQALLQVRLNEERMQYLQQRDVIRALAAQTEDRSLVYAAALQLQRGYVAARIATQREYHKEEIELQRDTNRTLEAMVRENENKLASMKGDHLTLVENRYEDAMQRIEDAVAAGADANIAEAARESAQAIYEMEKREARRLEEANNSIAAAQKQAAAERELAAAIAAVGSAASSSGGSSSSGSSSSGSSSSGSSKTRKRITIFDPGLYTWSQFVKFHEWKQGLLNEADGSKPSGSISKGPGQIVTSRRQIDEYYSGLKAWTQNQVDQTKSTYETVKDLQKQLYRDQGNEVAALEMEFQDTMDELLKLEEQGVDKRLVEARRELEEKVFYMKLLQAEQEKTQDAMSKNAGAPIGSYPGGVWINGVYYKDAIKNGDYIVPAAGMNNLGGAYSGEYEMNVGAPQPPPGGGVSVGADLDVLFDSAWKNLGGRPLDRTKTYERGVPFDIQRVLDDAGIPRYAEGGIAGHPPGTVPAFLERDTEAAVPLRGGRIPVEINDNGKGGGKEGGGRGGITVNFHVETKDADSFRQSRHQIEADLAAAVERANRRSA